MVKHASFKHGWFYHYRFCENKADMLCKACLSPLKDYFYDMLENCPHDYFLSGPRSSSLKFGLDAPLEKAEESNISLLAKEALLWNNFKTAHSNVEVFMLNYDKNTLAVELPIWISSSEFELFENLFPGETIPLSGHIDILQVIDEKVWILDYKPKAHLEKFAKTQVYFYALMLSKRTGIPLSNFMCGYFDDRISYVFSPVESSLKVPMLIENK